MCQHRVRRPCFHLHAAAVFFGQARHHKSFCNTTQNRWDPDSPLEHVMTACVSVAALIACFPWNDSPHVCYSLHVAPLDDLRSSQRMPSTPLSHLHAAVVELAHLETSWTSHVSSRQQVASHAHNSIAFSQSKSFPLGVFVQASLDTGWTQHADHGLWCVFGMFSPSRNGTPFIVCMYRTMRLNRVVFFRSDPFGPLSLHVCTGTSWTLSISNFKFFNVLIARCLCFPYTL